MLTGNKGEWSEVYTFFKLLGEGKLYAADADLNKIKDIYYPIIKILRSQSDGEWEYLRNGEIKLADGSTGKIVLTIPIGEFVHNARILLKKIKNSSGAFSIPELDKFMKRINCATLKASSGDKSDITLVVHDLNTGFKPVLGFSIKSRLGNASTLLNASHATNFIYKVNYSFDFDNNTIDEINSINTREKIRSRIKKIEEYGGKLQYYDMESTIFKLNLQVIDTNMPLILSKIVLYYYTGKSTDFESLSRLVEKENPCKYETEYNHPFYAYKIKSFLTDVALGMTPNTVWTGKHDATGGYIVVKEDGEVLCYHIYNRNEFEDYLLKNTKLDTPSSTRHEFGVLYRQKSKLLIKLNLQIRFKE